MPSRSLLVDALWASLPADTGKEAARRMTDQLGRFVDDTLAFHTMSRVRRNPIKYGFTVLHASKRSLAPRFMRVAVRPDGTFVMTREILDNADLGELANLAHAAQRMRNGASIYRASAEHLPAGTRRFRCNEVAEDMDDAVRKVERLAAFLREPVADGDTGTDG